MVPNSPHNAEWSGRLNLDRRTILKGEALPKESLPYRHGIHEAMGVLAGQWVTAVLATLAEKPMTYSDLLAEVNQTEERLGWRTRGKPLSKKVLTDTLHRMQRDALLVKIDRPSTFGNTWYKLTGVGRALLRALRPLAKWAEDSHSIIAESRAALAQQSRGPTTIA